MSLSTTAARRLLGVSNSSSSSSRFITAPLRSSIRISRRQYTSSPSPQQQLISPSLTLVQPRRNLSSTTARRSILPDSENPPPKTSEPHDNVTSSATEPTPLEDEAYHELADSFLERIAEKVDELAEAREDVTGEFESGVLNITFPPNGTYVLNKQPPNRQIWLSSPISGPKRYDWVVAGEGMHAKQGSGVGEWVYLRDGSTLGELLRKELGISTVDDAIE